MVVLGAGTAAECAARTALGLGASVKVFDKSINRLRDLQKTCLPTAAASFFQSVTGLLLMLLANFTVRKIEPENALF